MAKKVKIGGVVLYRGPSLIGGGNIVCVATIHSKNRKTGNMIQVWILPDDGLTPLQALQQGKNGSACGNCPLQGWYDFTTGRMVSRVCYVNVGQAPNAVWRKLQRGGYPTFNQAEHNHLFVNRKIRIGAYGDPAALPDNVLGYLTTAGSGWTGYSHQLFWIDPVRAQELAKVLMVSCHTPAQHAEAIRRGWRPFTAIRANQAPPVGSVQCPAYTHHVTCLQCGLCCGTQRQARPVYVIAHSKGSANLARVQSAAGSV